MVPILTLHDPERARRYHAEGVWRDDTLYGLLQQHAARGPERFALRDYRRRLTYGQAVGWVDAVAGWLHGLGLRRGQRVSVWLPNRVESVIVLLACSRNGYVCNQSLHQNYSVTEILALLRRLGTAVLITQAGYGADSAQPARGADSAQPARGADSAQPARGADSAHPARGVDSAQPARRADSAQPDIFARGTEAPSLRRVVGLAPLEGPQAAHGEFPQPAASAGMALPAPSTNADQVVYIAFTSGTTGEPKGVMHSDNTLLANARAMVADWGHTRESVILTLSPLSHHIATVAVAEALVAGAELAVNAPGPGRSGLDWIEETGATYVMGVPTHAIDLLSQLERSGRPRLGKVKVFYMAGSPIPIETAQRFLRIGITPQNVYGMSENGSHNYTLPSDDARTITETCGRPGKGYELRIWDQADPNVELPAGQMGEIGGRGGMLMLGYWGDQAATEASFNRHGWFMSGDLGILDENGCLRIVGRKKDLIIRGGHNIHPARIEDLAMRHPAVQKAAAFPVADERLGEKVCLAVIAVPEQPVSGAALLAHLHAAGLSKVDMPEYFIRLDDFPLTPSGKVLKRELAEWARSGRIRPEPVRWSEATK